MLHIYIYIRCSRLGWRLFWFFAPHYHFCVRGANAVLARCPVFLNISERHCYRYQCMSQILWNWFHATKTETMDDESIQLFASTVIQLLPNSSAAHVWDVGVLIFCSSLALNYEYIEIGAIIHCPTRQWRSGEVPSHCDIRGGCGTQSIFSRSHIVIVVQWCLCSRISARRTWSSLSDVSVPLLACMFLVSSSCPLVFRLIYFFFGL
jgi:hypothetical protein